MKNLIRSMLRAAMQWATEEKPSEDPGNSLEVFFGGKWSVFKVLRVSGPNLICTNGLSEYVIRSIDAKDPPLFWRIWNKQRGGSAFQATWEDGTPVDPFSVL